jgi:hypothetical protein
MKKSNLFSVLIVSFIMTLSCSVPDSWENVNNDAFLKSGKKHCVPFKSDFKITDSESSTVEDLMYQLVYGMGNATHMGKTELFVDEVITMNENLIWTAVADVVLTAANGDKLNFNYNSEFDVSGIFSGTSDKIIVVGEGTITGGSGRFEDASGNITYNGIFYPAAPTNSVAYFTGVIMY